MYKIGIEISISVLGGHGTTSCSLKDKNISKTICRDCFELNTYALIPLSTTLLARSQADTALSVA